MVIETTICLDPIKERLVADRYYAIVATDKDWRVEEHTTCIKFTKTMMYHIDFEHEGNNEEETPGG